ncbi:hypothetical protein ACWD4J_44070, partial [Streptomyces sp. NPDC002577]
RGSGSHLDPREAELMRGMERAGSPQEARAAEQQLRDYLAGREQQRQVVEQQRLEQLRTHEQDVTRLRDQLTQQRRTGAPEEVVQQTQRQLEQAQQRLADTRTHDENTAALRHELRQQIDRPESGSDRPGAGSGTGRGGGTESGSGSGSRLDRLVQEGISRRAEQDLARAQEEQQFLRQEPDEHDAFTLDELDDLPSAPTAKPDSLPNAPTDGLESLPDVPTGRPEVPPGAHTVEPGTHTIEPDGLPSVPAIRPEPPPGMPAGRPELLPDVPRSGTRPDDTVPTEPRPVGDEPRAPLSDEAADRIAAEIEGLPSAPVSPLVRPGDAPPAGQGHTETSRQARPQRVEPSAPRPGSDVSQAQRSRPAADTELPSAPASGPRVDRATMPSRVPQVADLERTLAEIEHQDTTPTPTHDTSATPPEHPTAPTDPTTAGRPEEQVAPSTTTPVHDDRVGDPSSGDTTQTSRTAETSSPSVNVPKPVIPQ